MTCCFSFACTVTAEPETAITTLTLATRDCTVGIARLMILLCRDMASVHMYLVSLSYTRTIVIYICYDTYLQCIILRH
jgi:hypothetical protein